MLVLPIKKKEEYREIKPYYDNRIGRALCGFPFKMVHPNLIKECMETKTIDVIFRNGYYYESPSIWCTCKVKIGQGKEEWGAEPEKEYYILEILEVQNDGNV